MHLFCIFSEGQCYVCKVSTYIKKIYCHVFLDKDYLLSFSVPRRNIIFLREKKCHLSRYYKKAHIHVQIFRKGLSFRNIWRKHHISKNFFRERSSSLSLLKNKIIFSGKINIIFPDNTRKIMFQCGFFSEGYPFRTFGERKHGFSCSVLQRWFTIWMSYNMVFRVVSCFCMRAED